MKKKKTRQIFASFFLLAAVCVTAAGIVAVWKDRYGNGRGLSLSSDGYYQIYDAGDYEEFMECCSSQADEMPKGRLMQDIYLNDTADIEDWQIQPPERKLRKRDYFYGVLDGNGHTVYGLYSEYGYGVAMINHGVIQNLTIKDSLVIGEKYAGGICYRNCGEIEQCCFWGTLVCRTQADQVQSMAGICNENKDGCLVNLCRYLGEMRTGAEGEAGEGVKTGAGRMKQKSAEERTPVEGVVLAGICYDNEGEITNCCNLAENRVQKAGYAITDRGAENCYAGKDMGWITGTENECMELGEERRGYVSFYMRKDWYGLYLAQKGTEGMLSVGESRNREEKTLHTFDTWMQEMERTEKEKQEEEKQKDVMKKTEDAVIAGMLQKMLVYCNLDFPELVIGESDVDGKCLFSLDFRDETTGEEMMIAKYPMEEAVFEDYGKLWQVCEGYAEESGEEAWEHRTWQIVWEESREEIQKQPGKVIFYRCGESDGMFYVLPDAAYQITFGGNEEKWLPFWWMAKKLPDVFADWEGEEGQTHVWQIPFHVLDGKAVLENGVAWDFRAKEAAYQEMGWEPDYFASVEDIWSIERLNFDGIPLENLDFVKEIKNLSFLSAAGCGLGEIPAWGKMEHLVYLNLENNAIRDISPLADCPALETLKLSGNRVMAVSVLHGLERLESVTLEEFWMEDFVIDSKDEDGTEDRQREEEARWEGDPVVGTWKTNTGVQYTALEQWLYDYYTCFSPDGRVVHYGHRNVDIGSWERIDENTVTAFFGNCIYFGTGSRTYPLPAYTVTYYYDSGSKDSLQRSTQRERRFMTDVEEDGKIVRREGSDFDCYGCLLRYESEDYEKEKYEIEKYYAFSTADFPEEGEFCPKLERRLAEIAQELAQGKEVELEQIDLPYDLKQAAFYDITGDGKEELFVFVSMLPHHMNNYSGATYILSENENGVYTVMDKNTRNLYNELLAPDGTVLLEDSIYRGASSWKGGTRIHLGYREGKIVVDKDENYWFHWDLPLMNWGNDYKNGKSNVYIARNPTEGEGEKYGWYIEIEDSLKIDEESFPPKFIPFAEYDGNQEYPAQYYQWSPFDESWWEAGGHYTESDGGNYAYWLEEAADDHPNELLEAAVEQSGIAMEKKAYPWTAETKKNVMEILRCPVADFYYESEDYAAEYVRGGIVFHKKPLYEKEERSENPRHQLSWEKMWWKTIWSGIAEEAPPAVCYQGVLEEFEGLWKAEKAEIEQEYPDGYGNYAGLNYVNMCCADDHQENWQLCYSLADISGEGIDELFIGMRYTGKEGNAQSGDEMLYAVFTCQNGKITNVLQGENMGEQDWRLCKGNVLEISRAAAGYGDYWYYRLKPYGAEAEMTDTFGYDAYIGGDGAWKCDYYDSGKEPMTEADYEEKLKMYEPVEMEWKVLEGFIEENQTPDSEEAESENIPALDREQLVSQQEKRKMDDGKQEEGIPKEVLSLFGESMMQEQTYGNDEENVLDRYIQPVIEKEQLLAFFGGCLPELYGTGKGIWGYLTDIDRDGEEELILDWVPSGRGGLSSTYIWERGEDGTAVKTMVFHGTWRFGELITCGGCDYYVMGWRDYMQELNKFHVLTGDADGNLREYLVRLENKKGNWTEVYRNADMEEETARMLLDYVIERKEEIEEKTLFAEYGEYEYIYGRSEIPYADAEEDFGEEAVSSDGSRKRGRVVDLDNDGEKEWVDRWMLDSTSSVTASSYLVEKILKRVDSNVRQMNVDFPKTESGDCHFMAKPVQLWFEELGGKTYTFYMKRVEGSFDCILEVLLNEGEEMQPLLQYLIIADKELTCETCEKGRGFDESSN